MANKKTDADETPETTPAPAVDPTPETTPAPAESTTTAIAVKGESDIVALQGESDLKEIIEENFGGTGLTLADLDKLKVPAAGGVHWSIPSVLEGEEESTKELVGIILAWSDKKSWWAKSYNESGGGEQPDCKSNDMVHGIGNPASYFNEKEQALMDTGKAGMPVRDSGGWLCSTCPHNQFGSAALGAGKACQDKRFVIMMLQDSIVPVLLRVPATSIAPMKQYFKRLAGAKKTYFGVVTTLRLVKVKGTQEYSQVQPQAKRFLTDDEVARVRELRAPFQFALDADDAVEQAQVEKKPVAAETLNDMPGSTPAAASSSAPATPAKSESDPY